MKVIDYTEVYHGHNVTWITPKEGGRKWKAYEHVMANLYRIEFALGGEQPSNPR